MRQDFVAGEINKDELTKKMSDNLRVLRTKLQLKQSELAEKVGISRQALLEIEKGKRTLQWNVFVALLSVFREDSGTNDLLSHYEIYSPELSRYLVTPESDGSK